LPPIVEEQKNYKKKALLCTSNGATKRLLLLLLRYVMKNWYDLFFSLFSRKEVKAGNRDGAERWIQNNNRFIPICITYFALST
jgi:hypothetical protein